MKYYIRGYCRFLDSHASTGFTEKRSHFAVRQPKQPIGCYFDASYP